jgi:hypothetical protein
VNLIKGNRYNWKNQPERLVYIGMCDPRNGHWHQFAKVESPEVVWCEVLASDLHMLEETKDQPMTNITIDRALLERYLGMREGDWVEVGHELRDILAQLAPEVEAESRANDLASTALVTELREELADLKRDAERLDFMIVERAFVDSRRSENGHAEYFVSWPAAFFSQSRAYRNEREAIDAAKQSAY